MPKGAKPGERRGGRKKGTPNKKPDGPIAGKPKLSRKDIADIYLPKEAIDARSGDGRQISVATEPGGPHDPHYEGLEDPLDLLLAVVRDDRLAINYRMAAAKEVLPYVRSKMSPQPYKPPDHDGRIFIETVEFTEADFED